MLEFMSISSMFKKCCPYPYPFAPDNHTPMLEKVRRECDAPSSITISGNWEPRCPHEQVAPSSSDAVDIRLVHANVVFLS